MNVIAVPNTGLSKLSWWLDPKMVALVKRTAAKDCNEDEFNEFVAVSRDLNLSPLRKQIYAFVFSKHDAERRNMALIVGIDGGRAIAARTGNYRPDNRGPEWVFRDDLKDPLRNPHGIEKVTVGVMHRPTRSDPFERIVHTVYWDEYAPLVRSADPDAYEWVGTGDYYPQGHKRAGQEIQRKQLRKGASASVTERLDPKKEQWIRSGRNQLAKCAEMGALRKGWPEDLSRIYAEEETHRSTVIDGVDYQDLTPSDMVRQADIESRMERLGGPALLAALGDDGALVRVPIGQFADRMVEATERKSPQEVHVIVSRNREALKEFWAHNANDALELKKLLEQRSAGGGGFQASTAASQAKAAPSDASPAGGAAKPDRPAPLDRLSGTLAERHRDNLLRDIESLETQGDVLSWARAAGAEIDRLPGDMQGVVRAAFATRQSMIGGMS